MKKAPFKFVNLKATFLSILSICFLGLHAQTISTVAGNGSLGYSGDGGPAVSAQLGLIDGAVKYYAGNLYIVDKFSETIRKVDDY